ncbi:MAG: DUF2784 domain-containing protein [Sulfurimicrobium sp.]|nr:DUF2784 domain-containing protein [Sulfurimicrobium sp.]
MHEIAADLVVLLHFAFILFVVVGGFFALKWRKLAWLHVPAAIWGALIEFTGWICPLTPLENLLRQAGGAPGYTSGFIEYYILPLIYPADLTRQLQFFLGLGVVILNAAVYSLWFARRKKRGLSP